MLAVTASAAHLTRRWICNFTASYRRGDLNRPPVKLLFYGDASEGKHTCLSRDRHGCIRALRTPVATTNQCRRTEGNVLRCRVGRCFLPLGVPCEPVLTARRSTHCSRDNMPRYNPSAAVWRHLPLHRGGEARRENEDSKEIMPHALPDFRCTCSHAER